MATLLRHQTFCNQLRKLHRSLVRNNVPITYTMLKTKQKFQTVKPEVMASLMSSPKLKNQLPEVRNWLKTIFDYTLTDGKQAKGVAVAFGYQTMEDPKHFTEEKLHTTQFLGWCLEMLQASMLIIDDVIDCSTTRRGKPCWHLLPNVGTSAINDSVLIFQCFMEVLEIHFGKAPYYNDLISLVNETILYTSIGQYLDYSSGYTKVKDNLDSFTVDRLNYIATHKTAYLSFRMPVLAALFEVKDGKKRFTTEIRDICLDLGKLLQFQNDYKDVFFDQTATGMLGTDIEEGKLTWLSVKALELANKNQRAMFKEYYGSKDPEHVYKIRQLYHDLKLYKVYEEYEQKVHDDLVRRINALPREGEKHFFLEILETLRQRKY